jgi:hypothetical protein
MLTLKWILAGHRRATISQPSDIACFVSETGHPVILLYKGRRRKQIGRDLNVRYVLEGSVQRAGSRMRVNVQLVDAETGSHIWAEHFDKPVAELFDMQDEIVSRLANRGLGRSSLAPRHGAPSASQIRTQWIIIFSSLRLVRNKGQTADLFDKAGFHIDRALDLDPDNVAALVGRAWVDLAFVAPSWLYRQRDPPATTPERLAGRAFRCGGRSASARCASTSPHAHGSANCRRGAVHQTARIADRSSGRQGGSA